MPLVLSDKQKAEKDLLKRIVLWERADARKKLHALNPPKVTTPVKTPNEIPVKSENGKNGDGVSGSHEDGVKNGSVEEKKKEEEEEGKEDSMKKESDGVKSTSEKVVADVKIENGKLTDIDDMKSQDDEMDIEVEEVVGSKNIDEKIVEKEENEVDEKEKKETEKKDREKEKEEDDDDTDDNSMDSEDSDSLLASSVDDEEEVINVYYF